MTIAELKAIAEERNNILNTRMEIIKTGDSRTGGHSYSYWTNEYVIADKNNPEKAYSFDTTGTNAYENNIDRGLLELGIIDQETYDRFAQYTRETWLIRNYGLNQYTDKNLLPDNADIYDSVFSDYFRYGTDSRYNPGIGDVEKKFVRAFPEAVKAVYREEHKDINTKLETLTEGLDSDQDYSHFNANISKVIKKMLEANPDFNASAATIWFLPIHNKEMREVSKCAEIYARNDDDNAIHDSISLSSGRLEDYKGKEIPFHYLTISRDNGKGKSEQIFERILTGEEMDMLIKAHDTITAHYGEVAFDDARNAIVNYRTDMTVSPDDYAKNLIRFSAKGLKNREKAQEKSIEAAHNRRERYIKNVIENCKKNYPDNKSLIDAVSKPGLVKDCLEELARNKIPYGNMYGFIDEVAKIGDNLKVNAPSFITLFESYANDGLSKALNTYVPNAQNIPSTHDGYSPFLEIIRDYIRHEHKRIKNKTPERTIAEFKTRQMAAKEIREDDYRKLNLPHMKVTVDELGSDYDFGGTTIMAKAVMTTHPEMAKEIKEACLKNLENLKENMKTWPEDKTTRVGAGTLEEFWIPKATEVEKALTYLSNECDKTMEQNKLREQQKERELKERKKKFRDRHLTSRLGDKLPKLEPDEQTPQLANNGPKRSGEAR